LAAGQKKNILAKLEKEGLGEMGGNWRPGENWEVLDRGGSRGRMISIGLCAHAMSKSPACEAEKGWRQMHGARASKKKESQKS